MKCNAKPARIKSTQEDSCAKFMSNATQNNPTSSSPTKREHDDQLEKPPHFLQRGNDEKMVNVSLTV